jgi:hypothetical protein
MENSEELRNLQKKAQGLEKEWKNYQSKLAEDDCMHDCLFCFFIVLLVILIFNIFLHIFGFYTPVCTSVSSDASLQTSNLLKPKLDIREVATNDVSPNNENQSTYHDFIENRDFCMLLSSNLLNATEKLVLLLAKYDWQPTDKGKSIDFIAILALDSCTRFIGVSEDAIRVWLSGSSNPEIYSARLINKYSLSHNQRSLLISTKNKYVYHINLEAKTITKLTCYCYPKSVAGLYFMKDDLHILVNYEGIDTIRVYDTKKNEKVQVLRGILDPVEKVVTTESEVFIKDGCCVKVFFLHSDLPAYELHTRDDYRRVHQKYSLLSEFEAYFPKA